MRLRLLNGRFPPIVGHLRTLGRFSAPYGIESPGGLEASAGLRLVQDAAPLLEAHTLETEGRAHEVASEPLAVLSGETVTEL